MKKTNLLALQSLSSWYLQLDEIRHFFTALSNDKRLSDSLRFDFENAEKAFDDCFIALANGIKYLLSYELEETVHKDSN